MSTVKHAERELDIMGEDDALMRKHLMELVKLFDSQNHSGFSAMFCIHRLTKLLRYEALSKLSTHESEWQNDQNIRACNVFREKQDDGSYLYYEITNKDRIILPEKDFLSVPTIKEKK